MPCAPQAQTTTMSASHAGSPSDASQVNEDMGARISRLEMHMQQSSEAMRHQAELMESILRRLDTPPLALAGGDEQLTALRELAPMTLERRSGGTRTTCGWTSAQRWLRQFGGRAYRHGTTPARWRWKRRPSRPALPAAIFLRPSTPCFISKSQC